MQNISASKLVIQTLIILLASTMGYHPAVDTNAAVTEFNNDRITPSITTTTTTSIAQLPGIDNPSDEINVILESEHNEEVKTKHMSASEGSATISTPTIAPRTSSTATTTTTIARRRRTTTTDTPVPAKLSNALIAAATTVRTYLGMQSNITLKSSRPKGDSLKLTLPKSQKTDAPMLNYIFDSFSTANKHHHHDQRYGPHFEDIVTDGNVTNITVQAGSTVYLNCRISLLQDKTVSWVKRKANGEDALQLLTVGMHTYSGDSRYTMEFQYPNNWRLKIAVARKSDEGTYECQISTHPPRVIQINLHVNAPQVMIVDEYGAPLQEKYYEIDSTLQLSCVVRNVVMSSSVVFWSHGEQILNYDTTRGGVSVKTELMEDGANSTLFIARINKSDSGNYTCSINSSHEYNIMVHILNGESFAELHHGSCSRLLGSTTTIYGLLVFLTLLQISSFTR